MPHEAVPQEPSVEIDPLVFRSCAGAFTTGVGVVTTMDSEGQPVSVTINSFSTVSLAPPLILFSLARTLSSIDAFVAAKAYAVNILAYDAREISMMFAKRIEDRWARAAHRISARGCPLFHQTLSVFECRPCQVHDGGDHLIFVGRVIEATRGEDAEPLVFYRGQYGTFAAPATKPFA
jgi:3-hydroxy-9,10-secoandrosta-1,3,5(10)-triene-9,17-dione monooxygenase reductase component